MDEYKVKEVLFDLILSLYKTCTSVGILHTVQELYYFSKTFFLQSLFQIIIRYQQHRTGEPTH